MPCIYDCQMQADNAFTLPNPTLLYKGNLETQITNITRSTTDIHLLFQKNDTMRHQMGKVDYSEFALHVWLM